MGYAAGGGAESAEMSSSELGISSKKDVKTGRKARALAEWSAIEWKQVSYPKIWGLLGKFGGGGVLTPPPRYGPGISITDTNFDDLKLTTRFECDKTFDLERTCEQNLPRSGFISNNAAPALATKFNGQQNNNN